MTKGDKGQLLKLARSGVTTMVIARRLNVSRGTVQYHMRQNGIEATKTYKPISPSEREKIIRLYAEMRNMKEVGILVGRNPATIRYVLELSRSHKHGVNPVTGWPDN